MGRTIVVHVRYNSLYISLPSFAKQQREVERELRRLFFKILFQINRGVPDSVS